MCFGLYMDVFVRIYARIHMWCVYVYVYVDMSSRPAPWHRPELWVCVYGHMCIYVHTCINMYVYVYVCLYQCLRLCVLHTCKCAMSHISDARNIGSKQKYSPPLFIWPRLVTILSRTTCSRLHTHNHTLTCTYAHAHTHTHTHTHIHTHTYAHTHNFTYLHITHTCTRIHTRM
jgi:hypothetical protein